MASEDPVTSLEDAVGMPIDLNSIDKSLLLFYLAGKTPLSVADFAESCVSKSSTVGYILRSRFESETKIDMNNTLRLSGGTRRSIIRGGEPLINAGHEQLGRGKSHSSKENHTEAADCFAQAVSDFQCVIERYGAIDYESQKLEDVIATAKDRHDAAAVKAAKESINSHAVNATKYGQQAEKHVDDQPTRAAENYQKAADQLSHALEAAKKYNRSALKDDSKLGLEPIEQKLAEVSEKLDSLEKISATTSSEVSNSSDDTAAEEKTQSDPSDQDLIDSLQRLAARLGESPHLEFADKYGDFPANAYIESFGSWEDALIAANLDLIDKTVRNRRPYSRAELLDAIVDTTEKLGHIPSKTEMNSKGAVSSMTVALRFDDWSTALSFVEDRINVNSTEHENPAETRDLPKGSTSPDTDTAKPQSETEYACDPSETESADDRSNTASDVASEPATAGGKSESEELIEAIKAARTRLGRLPKADEASENSAYTPNDFYREFGDWAGALEAAGIDVHQGLVNDIRRVTEEIGEIPTTTDINESGIFSSGFYRSYFGSWDAVLEQATPEQESSAGSPRAEMLTVITSLHDRVERAPKATELPEDCGFSQYDFYDEFGSWDEALETAGIDRKQSIINEIERVARKLGQVPSTVDMQEHSAYTSYSQHFGSWDDALEQAQLADAVDPAHGREAMLEVVKDLENRIGRIPKPTELPDECEFSPTDFYTEFGSWDETLEAAGLNKEQALLDDIERIAEELDRTPTLTDMDEQGKYVRNTYSTHFDSWDEALTESNITESNRTRLIEKVQSLETRLGRLPKATDLQDISEFSQYDYIEEFGSWDEALEAANINKKQYFIDDLKRVADDVDGKPRTTDVNRVGEYSASMYQRYFASWDKALETAGITSAANGSGTTHHNQVNHKDTASLNSLPIEAITDDIAQVNSRILEDLKTAGYRTLGDLADADTTSLMEISGIGAVTANNMKRIANRNLSNEQNQSDAATSSNNTASSRFSTSKPNTTRASARPQNAEADEVQPGALETSWETITGNERIDGQFLIRVSSADRASRGRESTILTVQDRDGRSFEMIIWAKDNIEQEWAEDRWYVIEGALGRVWESSDTTTQKVLSSTKDLVITDLGEDFDPSTALANNKSDPASEPESSSATDGEDTLEATSGSAPSSRNTERSGDQDESDERDDTEPDDDGILGDIASDFDNL